MLTEPVAMSPPGALCGIPMVTGPSFLAVDTADPRIVAFTASFVRSVPSPHSHRELTSSTWARRGERCRCAPVGS